MAYGYGIYVDEKHDSENLYNPAPRIYFDTFAIKPNENLSPAPPCIYLYTPTTNL
jgi:hypothetical protein